LHLVIRLRASGATVSLTAGGSNLDDDESVGELVAQHTCAYLYQRAKFQPNQHLIDLVFSLSVEDVAIHRKPRLLECQPTETYAANLGHETVQDGVFSFSMNGEKANLVWAMIMSEATRCASECGLQLGQIGVEMLGLGKAIGHLIHGCILPSLHVAKEEEEKESRMEKENEPVKEFPHVEAWIFYDGENAFNDDAPLSYAPDEWSANMIKDDKEVQSNSESHTHTTNSIRQLPDHMDDSDVTINLCIGGKFTGGKLTFTMEDGCEREYQHVVGDGVAHWGHLRHRVSSSQGERFNMLLFLKT